MNAEAHDEEPCEATLDEAKAELGRLLSDTRFRGSERQCDILRYLAERRFKGCRGRVKAYSIALDVLGRPSGFDASTDPIVRIEISRLRAALGNYYSMFGSDLGISVYIPKGSYVVLFPRTPTPNGRDDDLSDGSADDRPDGDASASGLRAITRPWHVYAAGAAAVACLVAAAVVWALFGRPPMTEKPSLVVAMTAASPDMAGEAGLTSDMFLTALTQFQTVVVSRPGSPSSRYARSYEVDLKYYGDGNDRMVWWQVVDTGSGSLLQSGVEKVEIEGKTPLGVREELAGALARHVASSRGVVNMMEVEDAPQNALGNACILRSEYDLDQGDPDAAASLCLERTLARSPDDADALSVLARAKVFAGGPENISEAVKLAKRAITIRPLSDRAQTALMAAQFAAGRTQAAIEAGNRSMALNPNNAGTAAGLSLILFSSGQWKAATGLARDAAALSDPAPRYATLVLALDAYRNGRWSEASLLAEQANGHDLITRSLRAAALGELGSEDAKARLFDATAGSKDFERRFRRKMEAYRMQPEIADGLEAGLSKAGANFDTVAGIAEP